MTIKLTFKIINAPFLSTWSWAPNLLKDESEIKPGGTVAFDSEAVININVGERDTIRAMECDIYNHPANYDTMRAAHSYKVIWSYPWLETGTYVIDWETGTISKYKPVSATPIVVTDPIPLDNDMYSNYDPTEVASKSNTWIWAGLICLVAAAVLIIAGAKES